MKTTFVNGVFDLLHPGHVNLLLFARHTAGAQGKVIVALDSDEKVMVTKGYLRPIYNFPERRKMVLSLQHEGKPVVDTVEIFHTNLELQMVIKRIRPDYIVKGGDHKNTYVIGSDVAPVLFFDRMDDYSTTDLIKRVLEKNKV